MHLSTIDRLVRKLEPVNALVEKLCERVLPHKVAYATAVCLGYGGGWVCFYSQGCGVETGSSYESCCVDLYGNYYNCSCGC
jgi:hypothetical protein